MKGKISKAILLVLLMSLATVGVAFAEEDTPAGRIRFVGEIMNVDLAANAFKMHTRSGKDVDLKVNPATQFQSPNGSVQGLSDLQVGMHALVSASGSEEGVFVAKLVITRAALEERRMVRALGEITSVEPSENQFDLTKRDGEIIPFQVGDRTRFRSREGEIKGIEDLEPGMVALVIGFQTEDELVFATVVAAGQKGELPSNPHQVRGEITNIVPGQGTFNIETQSGESLTLHTSERTRFRSRDGSVNDIHDLKKGMTVLVGVVEEQDGTQLALLVLAGDPQDSPVRPKLDVRVAGRIAAKDTQNFTLEKRGGERMTFNVDDATVFKSRDGRVNGLSDIEIGMIAVVGAKESASGQFIAVWVGVGQPLAEPSTDIPDQPGRSAPGSLFVPGEM
jgi:hypothetical protein